MRGVRATPDAAAQLMQLRQSESLGVFNEHDRCIRNIDSHFDHSRADQGVRLSGTKPLHDALLVGRTDPAMQQFAAKPPQTSLPLLEFFRRSLGIELFALIDERINDISLAAGV